MDDVYVASVSHPSSGTFVVGVLSTESAAHEELRPWAALGWLAMGVPRRLNTVFEPSDVERDPLLLFK